MAQRTTERATTKRDAWRDARVAAEYEARRFATPLGRLKHRRDAALVLALLSELGGAGYRVVGADVALEMMRECRDGRALVQADAARLPFASASFDAVVSLRFLFHLNDAERERALAEMRRVTKDGVVVGEVRYRWTLKHLGRWLRSRVGLARRYRPSASGAAIARELESAGLELVSLRPVSRLFSDKALFLARPDWKRHKAIPAEVGLA